MTRVRDDHRGPVSSGPPDGEPPGGVWGRYFGPVVLNPRRRTSFRLLVLVWVAATIGALATGRYDIVWLPLAGIATSATLLLRDHAGRGRRFRHPGGPGRGSGRQPVDAELDPTHL